MIVLGDGTVFIDGAEPVGGSRTCNRDLLHLSQASEIEAQQRAQLELMIRPHRPGEKWCSSPYQELVHPQNDGWLKLEEFGSDPRNADSLKGWCKHCCTYAEGLRRQRIAENEGRELRPRRS